MIKGLHGTVLPKYFSSSSEPFAQLRIFERLVMEPSRLEEAEVFLSLGFLAILYTLLTVLFVIIAKIRMFKES